MLSLNDFRNVAKDTFVIPFRFPNTFFLTFVISIQIAMLCAGNPSKSYSCFSC